MAKNEQFPGAEASKPQQIPAKGWLQVTKRAWSEAKEDQVPLMAAGVAFWSFLSLFPAMIAAVSIYGLFADPQTVTRQAEQLSSALPDAAATLITTQLKSLASGSGGALGLSLIISVLAALWSASGGVGNLITAINLTYDEEETRGFVKRKLLALGLTLGAILFAVIAIGLIAVVPVLLEALVPSGALYWLLQALRWLGLLLAVTIGLAVLYRFAPDRDAPQFRWVSTGAGVATVIWLVASVGFAFYVNNFGSYNETYGALAGVIVLLLWLFITVFVVLLGAEINSESEHQTVKDTTKGEPKPLGERRAVQADAVPGEDPEEARERQRAERGS